MEIPDILKKYNPNIFGYSVGIGSPNVWEISYLNVAVPGAIAADLPGQARTLVSLLHNHPESVNYEEDWKLLNIFIGGNDMCAFCNDQKLQPSECVQNIYEAIEIIYDNVPRVIVSVTAMLQLEILRQSDKGRLFCQGLHKEECPCESNTKNFNDSYLADACIDYANREMDLAASGRFDKKDFTVVTQPFFRDINEPPMKNGEVNKEFFAPDCFHFSQWGHALVSSWLWKNILEPVGAKTTQGSASVPSLPLACPDPACPFIRTNENSKDCSKYMTPVAN
ncbi:GDSL-like protein [Oesophagostomum dentatum]|uniref:GDSL-like protein n=1 Tax=Oesophagostomum dentatum TaxID=61180 RepID=A0A0B1SQY5_OESDE|nr:GDSL-like protein [Oesophagostomum dentatum]